MKDEDLLGPHAGDIHILKQRAIPDFNDPPEFGLTLLVKWPDEDNWTMARIDTDHGGTHIDRLWLKTPDKEFHKGWGYWDAYGWFFDPVRGVERWRVISNEYRKNHVD